MGILSRRVFWPVISSDSEKSRFRIFIPKDLRFLAACCGVSYLIFSGFISSVFAVADKDPEFRQWSKLWGKVEFGLVFKTVSNNLCNENDRNEKISSLDSPYSVESLEGPVMVELNYLLREDLVFYFGTPFLDDDRDGFTVGLGKTFEDESYLDCSAFANSYDIWKDPYITGRDRKDTTMIDVGMALDYSRICGTGFNLTYKLHRRDVDKDVIGDNDRNLARSGYLHESSLKYDFVLNENSDLIAGATLRRGDMDGKAESYDGYSFDLSYSYDEEDYSLYSTFYYGENTYDLLYPVFAETREDRGFGFAFILTRNNLFGNPRLYARYGFGYEDDNSNIDYYDSSTFLAGSTIGFYF